MSAQEVEEVIRVVYGGGGIAEPARRDALAWLQRFSQSRDAWAVSFELLRRPAQTTVHFYAANILSTKVTRYWHDEPPQVKEQVLSETLALVRVFVGDTSGVGSPDGGTQDSGAQFGEKPLQRVVLALAMMAAQTPQVVDAYMAEAWRFLQIGMEKPLSIRGRRALFTCTEMLKVLPEEREALLGPGHLVLMDLDPEGIDQKMLRFLPQVLEAVQQVLHKQEDSKFQARALECLQSWAPFGINVVRLRRCGLLKAILMALLSCQDLELLEAASAALIASTQQKSAEAMSRRPESDETLEAFDDLVESVRALKQRLEKEQDEKVAMYLCRVVVVVAERQLDRIVIGISKELLDLVDMILHLSAHPSKAVAILTTNFWLSVQDYPLAERHESLREPCYLKLLEIFLQQSRLNLDSSSGSEEDVDEDVENFRNGGDGVKDPLISIFYVLGQRYAEVLHGVLRNAQEWQTFEAALFALSATATEIVSQTSDTAGPRATSLRASVETLLLELPDIAMLGTNGATLRSGVKLFGDLSRILARMSHSAIERVMEYVLFALPFSSTVSCSAANALCKICTACKLELGMHPDGVKHMASRIDKAFQSFPTGGQKQKSSKSYTERQGHETDLPLQARIAVVEGITRVSCFMKLQQCTETLVILLNPGLERLSKAVENVDARTVTNELQILGCAVKFVQVNPKVLKGPLDHPVAGILNTSMPLLEKVSSIQALQQDADVVDSLYSLISTSFVAAKAVLALHLESLLVAAVAQFRITWSPCCITCLGNAVEIYPSATGFVGLFAKLTAHMVIAIKDGYASDNPQIVAQYFGCAVKFLVFCPEAIFNDKTLPVAAGNDENNTVISALVQIVAKCISGDEADSVRACALFIMPVISRVNGEACFSGGKSLQSYKPTFDAALRQHGQLLVEELLLGITGRTPATPLPRVIQVFADLIVFYNQFLQEAVYNAFIRNADDLSKLSASDKEAFVLTIPYLGGGIGVTAKDACANLSRVARKEISSPTFQSSLESMRNSVPNEEGVVDLS